MSTYLRASALSGLDDLAVRYKKDLFTALETHGIDAGIFRAQEAEVPFENACALLDDCSDSWSMPNLGVLLSRYHTLETLGVVSLVTRMELSVRGALSGIIRNQYLHTNGAVVALNEPADTGPAELVLSLRTGGMPVRQFRESAICNARNILECVADQKVQIYHASMPHRAPAGRDALSAELQCPVQYGSDRCVIMFDRSALDIKLDRSDVAFHPIIRRYLAEVSAEKGNSFSEIVRTEVFRQLSLGSASQDRVAAALQVQPRTLQRRLKLENNSFRNILDEERRKRALSLVQQTQLPFSEVALAVGYSDQTAFNQAFKRWFNRSPLKVRRGLDLIPLQS